MSKYTRHDAIFQRNDDELRTMLRRAIDALSDETLGNWMGECIETLNDPSADVGDKLEANAMLVGVCSIIGERGA